MLYTDSRGFTLIELMVVIAILTIISLFATSAYSKYTRDVQITHATQELSRIAGTVEMERLKGKPYNSTEMADLLKSKENSEIVYKGKVIYNVSFKKSPLTMKQYTLQAVAKDPAYFGDCAILWINQLGQRGNGNNGAVTGDCW